MILVLPARPSSIVFAIQIVANLDNAPFFHLIFNDKAPSKHRLRPETVADPDNWSAVKDVVLSHDPETLILVHKIEDEPSQTINNILNLDNGVTIAQGLGLSRASTSIWGLVVLSKAMEGHECYIMKTTRETSAYGWTTRFQVTKAECFSPSVHEQLERAWLAR